MNIYGLWVSLVWRLVDGSGLIYDKMHLALKISILVSELEILDYSFSELRIDYQKIGRALVIKKGIDDLSLTTGRRSIVFPYNEHCIECLGRLI